jgi:hypothetical protein
MQGAHVHCAALRFLRQRTRKHRADLDDDTSFRHVSEKRKGPSQVMRYKAEILSVIYQRNAKHRQAQLPLPHVRAEYEAEIIADREDDFELKVQAVLTDAIERSLILKWVARWQRQHKTNRWPSGMGILVLLREHLALPTPIGQQDRRVCSEVPDRLCDPPPHATPRLFPATTLPAILVFP